MTLELVDRFRFECTNVTIDIFMDVHMLFQRSRIDERFTTQLAPVLFLSFYEFIISDRSNDRQSVESLT